MNSNRSAFISSHCTPAVEATYRFLPGSGISLSSNDLTSAYANARNQTRVRRVIVKEALKETGAREELTGIFSRCYPAASEQRSQ